MENNQSSLNADLIIEVVMEGREAPELAMYTPKGIKPFHTRPPDLRHPLADEFAQIRMVSGLWANYPIRSSGTPLHPLRPPKRNIGNQGTQVGIAR